MKKQAIKKGDIVKMNDKYWVSEVNKERVFEVMSDPWNLCGCMCVLLDKIKGGYAVDGLTKVE